MCLIETIKEKICKLNKWSEEEFLKFSSIDETRKELKLSNKEVVIDSHEIQELNGWNIFLSNHIGTNFIRGNFNLIHVRRFGTSITKIYLEYSTIDTFIIDNFNSVEIRLDESKILNFKINKLLQPKFVGNYSLNVYGVTPSLIEKFQADLDFFNQVKISNLELLVLMLKSGKACKASIKKCDVLSYQFEDLKDYSSIEIDSVYNFNSSVIKCVNKHILVRDSILDNRFKILNSNLSKHTIELKNSEIADIRAIGSLLPYKIDFKKYKIEDELNVAKYTILQLKSIAINNNDRGSTISCEIQEQKINYKLTSWKQFWTKTTQGLNHITNNFGSNWWLPALEFFGIGIIFYLWISWVNGLSFDLSVYGQFLIPTHKLDIFGDVNCLKEGTGLIDFFSRIVLGYLIYQFISAFRKFSK